MKPVALIVLAVVLSVARAFSAADLGRLSQEELVKVLWSDNSWQRRTAQRLLSERLTAQDRKAIAELAALAGPKAQGMKPAPPLETRLSALWALHGSGQLAEAVLAAAATDKEPAMRAWAARLAGERGDNSESATKLLADLARDTDPAVRVAVAVACRQLIAGSLTVTTPDGKGPDHANTALALDTLAKQPGAAEDPLLPFLIWMAGEPYVAANPKSALDWLRENGATTMPLSGQLAYKTMRRICDLQKPDALNNAVDFLAALPVEEPLLAFALNGLVDGQKGKAVAPTKPTDTLFTRLLASPRADTVKRAQQLGTLWGDARALEATLAAVNNTKAPLDDRIKAVQTARQLKSTAARDALLRALAGANPDALTTEIIRALGEVGGDMVSEKLLGGWKNFSPAVRRTSAEVLASRDRWASALLSALEQKTVSPADISAATIRTLTRSQGDYGMLARRAALIFGRVRDADQDKLKLIAAKKQMILGKATSPDLQAGYEIAKKTCFICHKLHGEGADVGPDLTGVGRSSLDALLANVIDPNQIIGAGYEMVEVETKDGRSVSGRLVENTGSRVKLLSAGPKEDVVARSDIAKLRVSELSVMPEGLEQMPDADFRNLIGYILNPPGDKSPFSWHHEDSAASRK